MLTGSFQQKTSANFKIDSKSGFETLNYKITKAAQADSGRKNISVSPLVEKREFYFKCAHSEDALNIPDITEV